MDSAFDIDDSFGEDFYEDMVAAGETDRDREGVKPEPQVKQPPAQQRKPSAKQKPAQTRKSEPQPAEPRLDESKPAVQPEPRPAEPRLVEQPEQGESVRPETRRADNVDELKQIRTIINTYNEYVNLTDREKEDISRLINSGENVKDEYEFVQKAVNVKEGIFKSISAIVKAYELEDIDRVYYVLGLRSSELSGVVSILQVFGAKDFPDARRDKNAYTKKIVTSIGDLPSDSIDFLETVEKVLSVAKGQ